MSTVLGRIKNALTVFVFVFSMIVAPFALQTTAVYAAGGFDQFGYNYTAHNFVGLADGVDRNLDGTVWGDPTYANDHLVMKWNAQWDNCNANGYDNPTYCAGAWTTNEWNGMLPDGSTVIEHYKIIWVGSLASASPYWRDGGYSVWGNYEVIMDQGMSPSTGHFWYALATPNGLH